MPELFICCFCLKDNGLVGLVLTLVWLLTYLILIGMASQYHNIQKSHVQWVKVLFACLTLMCPWLMHHLPSNSSLFKTGKVILSRTYLLYPKNKDANLRMRMLLICFNMHGMAKCLYGLSPINLYLII